MANIIHLNNELPDDEKQKLESVYVMRSLIDRMTINNNEDYVAAADLLGDLIEKQNQLETLRKKLKKPVLEMGKNIEEMFRSPSSVLTECKQIINKKMLQYVYEVRKELHQIEREISQKTQAEKHAIEQQVKGYLDKGEYDNAQEAIDSFDVMPIPNVHQLPVVKGVSTRKNWKCRPTDIKALLTAILDGKAPLELLTFNYSFANDYARSVRNTLTIPGVEFYCVENIIKRK